MLFKQNFYCNFTVFGWSRQRSTKENGYNQEVIFGDLFRSDKILQVKLYINSLYKLDLQ